MALFNISLTPEGIQILLSKKGFVKELAQNFLTSHPINDFESRIVSLKLIQLLINKSNENKLSLFSEMVEVMPIKTLQYILLNDSKLQVRENCGLLLAAISVLKSQVFFNL
jgi:hypothetical protein